MAKKMLTTGVLGNLMHSQMVAEADQSVIETRFDDTFASLVKDGYIENVVNFFCDLEAALAAADMKRLPSEQVQALNLETWTTGRRKNQTSALRKAIKAGATWASMSQLFYSEDRKVAVRSIEGLAKLWTAENRPPEEQDEEILQEAAAMSEAEDKPKTQAEAEPIKPAEIAAQLVKDFDMAFAVAVAEEIIRMAENHGMTEQAIILEAVAETEEDSAAA